MSKKDLLYKLVDMLQGVDESDLTILKDIDGNTIIKITPDVLLKRNYGLNPHVENLKKEIVWIK